MSESPLEIEAKFLAADESVLESIGERRELAGYRLERVGTKRLRTVYLDTLAGDLSRTRIALRIRRQGPHVEATVKLPGVVTGAVHRRPEITVPLASFPRLPWRRIPSKLAALLPASAGPPFTRIAETRVRRTLLHVLRENVVVAEIALDRVGGGRERAYFEVEIELARAGARRDLERLSRRLRKEHRLEPSRQSKLERALERGST